MISIKTRIFKNLSILLSVGLIVKVLGLFHRILMSRSLNVEGLSLYAKMMPIATFFGVLASFSLGSSITQFVAKNLVKKPYSNRDLMAKGFKIATISASIVSIIHLLTNYLITHYLLQTDILFKPFIYFIPLYYLQSYTGVFKGYFHGHNKMDTYAIGQLIEQIVRIILIYVFITPMLKISLEAGIKATVISLSIGELCQNIFLFCSLFKFTKIFGKKTIKADTKALIKTSFDITNNRIANALCKFLEPIVFTFAFQKTGMDKMIADELYGIIYGYVIPLIFITSFITTAIETAILPELITHYKKKETKEFNSVMNKTLFFSFIPAVITTITFYFFSEEMLQLFYHTKSGATYLKMLAITSFLTYFDGVFIAAIMASDNEKKLVKVTILTNIIYLSLIFFLVSIPKINIMGIIYSLSIFMSINPIIMYLIAKKYINYHLPKKSILYLGFYILSIILTELADNIIILIICYLLFAAILLINKNAPHHSKDN